MSVLINLHKLWLCTLICSEYIYDIEISCHLKLMTQSICKANIYKEEKVCRVVSTTLIMLNIN